MNEPDILERLLLLPKNLMVAVDEGSYLAVGQIAHDAAMTIIRLRQQVEQLKEKGNDRG